jgi:hypothetical protein
MILNRRIHFKLFISNFILFRLYKYYIIDSILFVKKEGFRQLLRKRGWKFLLVIISYYAIRDSILYLIIPYLMVSGFL